jgi:hypothetical protein
MFDVVRQWHDLTTSLAAAPSCTARTASVGESVSGIGTLCYDNKGCCEVARAEKESVVGSIAAGEFSKVSTG